MNKLDAITTQSIIDKLEKENKELRDRVVELEQYIEIERQLMDGEWHGCPKCHQFVGPEHMCNAPERKVIKSKIVQRG